ncbi:MAG: FKBP-type peptidyl-prolyl cis-trans isomerase, partial [Acidobacteria bacterium]|nr:FKBP-type peptidyl-prolyl cis-trans isomerase [Acidobacteriota bacterium]
APTPDNAEAPPDSAERSESGLRWQVLVPGTGKTHPTPHDRVRVRYTTRDSSGRVVPNRIRRPTTRDAPAAVFVVRDLSPGFAEGLQGMVEGERRKLWIPAELTGQGAVRIFVSKVAPGHLTYASH